MPRVRRQHCQMGLYHVIQRADTEQLFNNTRDKEMFLTILEQSKAKNGFSLFGFCLAYPKEYHLIIGTGTADLSQVMKEINIRYALYKQTNQLFRDRFISKPLDQIDQIKPIKEMLIKRRTDSQDQAYFQLCTAHHHLIDDPLSYTPCEALMDIEAVKQDLSEELARTGLSYDSFCAQPEVRNDWIKRIRRSSPLSLKQIGTLVGLSESSISKILNS